MYIAIHDLEIRPVEFDVELPEGAIEYGEDIRQNGVLKASGIAELLREEHSGQQQVLDIRLRGNCAVKLEQTCSRCLEPAFTDASAKFDLVYRPQDAGIQSGEHSISQGETEIGYYNGEGLQLEDALKEQILLTLPVRPLCKEDCKGLCAHCGENLNMKTCACNQQIIDPRWLALASVKEKLKK
jgi:uncharacterized protein